MIRREAVLCLLLAVLCYPVRGQERPFYYRGNEKIYLTPDESQIAAKTTSSVTEKRFTKLPDVFYMITASPISPSAEILVPKQSTSREEALAAIAHGTATQEIHPLPRYRVGDLHVILQNEIIVKFKPGVPSEVAEGLLRRFGSHFRKVVPSSDIYLLSIGNPGATLKISQILHDNHNVEYAQPNFLVFGPSEPSAHKKWQAPPPPQSTSGPLSSVFPSDPLYGREWSLQNKIADSSFGNMGADMRVRRAWDVTRGSDQIRIAVLDDGVDMQHPDLKDSLIYKNGVPLSFDAINDGTSNPPQQGSFTNPHGTRVAGVIAAKIDNGIGLAGIAPDAKIVPIRVGDSKSSGGKWTTPVWVVKGFEAALKIGADVIVGSWYCPPDDPIDVEIKSALAKGRSGKGVVMVFAAGDNGNVTYPASLAETLPVIAVGATNSWDEVKTNATKDGEDWWSSAAGPALTVVAPGVGIVTTDYSGTGPPKYMYDFDETSSAAPAVAAEAALILSRHPELTAKGVKDLISTTADKIGGPNRTDAVGWGRVNICRAVGGTECD